MSIIDHVKHNSKLSKVDKKNADKFILSITENGYGKRTPHLDYRVTNRGGKGIINITTSQRNGNVSSSFPVSAEDEIIISLFFLSSLKNRPINPNANLPKRNESDFKKLIFLLPNEC